MTYQQTPILYINLASRPDRRAFMEAQFDQLGLVAERVEAVTIPEVPAELVESHLRSRHRYRCSPAHLACGLSHVAAWELAIERGYESVIVLEDDAKLTQSFAAYAEPGLLSRVGADMIKLETWRKAVVLGAPRASVAGTELKELMSTQLGAAAYLISRGAIERSLASPVLNRYTVDQLLFGRGGPHLLISTLLQATPSPAIQLDKLESSDLGQSNIAASRDEVRARFGRNRYTDIWGMVRLSLEHAGRLVRLVLRDPAVLTYKRAPVPFEGDPVT